MKQEGLLFVSDLNYENMIADLYYNDRHFATVWSNNNIFFINTPLPDANPLVIIHTIPLDIFMRYALKAQEELKKWPSFEDNKNKILSDNIGHQKMKRESVTLTTNQKYKNTVAKLYNDGKHFATIWHESDNYFIETPDSNWQEENITNTIRLDIFVAYMIEAQNRLKCF